MPSIIRSFAQVVDALLGIYSVMLIVYALGSWFSPDPYHPAMQFLRRFCEPVLEPIRRVIPPIGGVDLSVLIALFVLHFARSLMLY
ncbi:YggT family protein [Deltaproteobacteria bacterium TL4]